MLSEPKTQQQPTQKKLLEDFANVEQQSPLVLQKRKSCDSMTCTNSSAGKGFMESGKKRTYEEAFEDLGVLMYERKRLRGLVVQVEREMDVLYSELK